MRTKSMLVSRVLMASLLYVAAVGCSQPKLAGTNKNADGNASGANDPSLGVNGLQGNTDMGSGLGGTGDALTELEKQTLRKCLADWGQHPFDSNLLAGARRVSANVNIGGFGGGGVQDNGVTGSPQLLIVKASVSIGGTVQHSLNNPNGWYCLEVGVNLGSKVEVSINRNARLAGGGVNVNLFSSAMGEAANGIGVNVGANVSVIRI